MSTPSVVDPVKLSHVPRPKGGGSPHDGDALHVERELVERARTDTAAFGELYRRYVAQVHAFAWRRTGSRDAAEDITAATFEAVLRGLDRYRWRRGGFAPWLFRIASNEVIAHYRREGRATGERGQWAMATMTSPTVADDFTDDVLFDGADYERLRAALAALTPRYQRAIDVRYLAGLDQEAAARSMGLTKPAFAVVLSRALRALRREIEREQERGMARESDR